MNESPPPSYPSRFINREEAKSYVNHEYGASSYASAVWTAQLPTVREFFAQMRDLHPQGRHLDFACGTGRITKVAEEIFPEVDALDISSSMVELARETCPRAHFFVGNVLEDSGLCPGPYTSISSFRLLLNLDAELRIPILRQLHRRLDESGLLMVNVHGNKTSLRQPAIVWKKWRHGGHLPAGLMLNAMSVAETEDCLRQAGFEVTSRQGMGILPPTCYRLPLRAFWLGLDRWLSGWSFLQPYAIDVIFVCKKVQIPGA